MNPDETWFDRRLDGLDPEGQARVDKAVFDLKAEIAEQRTLGSYVIAPLSMLRCSECGDLLDYFGACKNHHIIEP